jgi:AcrR family transcriptional regulator
VSKGARTRLRILDAGARVLRQNGYAATRLSDIAEEAGLQTGSLAFHFPSKGQLLEEVLRHGMAVGLAQVRDAVEAVDTVEAVDRVEAVDTVEAVGPDAGAGARIAAAVHAHLDGLDQRNDYAPALLRSLAQFPAEERHRFRDLDHAYLEYWSGLLAAAQRAGAVSADLDAVLLARLLLGAMNATFGLPDVAPRERVVATVLSMLGLAAPGPALTSVQPAGGAR